MTNATTERISAQTQERISALTEDQRDRFLKLMETLVWIKCGTMEESDLKSYLHTLPREDVNAFTMILQNLEV